MKNAMIIFAVGVIAMLAAACNTVEGVGEDVEATGDSIEESAEGY